MAQLSYQNDFDQLRAGYPAEGHGGEDSITRTLEDATLQFGLGVVTGTAEYQCRVAAVGDTGATDFIGVAGKVENEDGEYVEDDAVKIWTTGRIAVQVPAAVTVAAGEPAYVSVAADADQGKFTNVVGTNTPTGAVFTGAKKNDNLAILAVNVTV